MKLHLYLLCIIAFTTTITSCSSEKETVTQLRCCNYINPDGIDIPRFSWQLAADDATQQAWEIEIGHQDRVIHHTKKVEEDKQRYTLPKEVVDKLENGVRYWWRVRLWNNQSSHPSSWSEKAYFSIGVRPEEWDAQWITATWRDSMAMPCFRKTFTPSGKIERAMAYVCGLGCYELLVNGRTADKSRILDPAQTNYEHYALYATYDVTHLMTEGTNNLGIMLGDGWYNQEIVWWGIGYYGKPILSAMLKIFYTNGETEWIKTDGTWQWKEGPVLKSNIYAGESYDARKEIQDWGSSTGDWQPAVVTTKGCIPKELHPQMIEPIRKQREIEAVDMWQDPQGNWVFDFGENVAAIPIIQVRQPAGTTLKMRMGESLTDNRSVDFHSTGDFATGVIQTDEYTCKGEDEEIWSPRFSYHGFRYLELSGVQETPTKDWIKITTVYTDVEQRGSFYCSDDQLNHLHQMCLRTLLSNLHGLPTDCPQRERCGWLGDAHAIFSFANYNLEMRNFWEKYMDDICSSAKGEALNTSHHHLGNVLFYEADKADGIPYMVAPGRRLCGVASPDWGTAIVQIPWKMYLFFGEKEILEKYYGHMRQWTCYVHTLLDQNGIVIHGLGDWCPPVARTCPAELSSTFFHLLDARLTSKAAHVLGIEEDERYFNSLADSIKQSIINVYYDHTHHTFGSQTANAMALTFNAVPEGDEQAVSDALVRLIEANGNFIDTGIFGLGAIGQALSHYGHAETALKLFTKKGENSFAYMWEKADATTLWESLPINEAAIRLTRNASLNHPMQAVFDSWFYEDIVGINPCEEQAGFKTILFNPTTLGLLEHAEGALHTPFGMAQSRWERTEEAILWEISIPAGSTGKVALPTNCLIKVNGEELSQSRYQQSGDKGYNNTVYYTFPSGSYTIEITKG